MVKWSARLRSRFTGLFVSLAVHVLVLSALAAAMVAHWDRGVGLTIESVSLGNDTSPTLELFPEPTRQPTTSSAVAASLADTPGATTDVDHPLSPSHLANSLGTSFWRGRQREIAGMADREAAAESHQNTANFFGVEANGERIVYVVDCSLSMRGARWQAARAELIRSLESLDQDVSFLVVFFSEDCYPMPGSVLRQATKENIVLAADWIRSASLGWGTKPLQSVQLAHAQRPDTIFLLTDGEFGDRTAQFLREENAALGPDMTSVHTIAFHSREGIRLLRRIARENSGQFRYVGK